MKIVVIGNSGQLSFELSKQLESQTVFLGPEDTDITKSEVLGLTLSKIKPDLIINAAAYTAVDKAEEQFELCNAVNANAVRNLAEFCKSTNAFLVHVSTDYVFNGEKGSPYLVDDPIEPQGVYGKTKAAGEKVLLDLLPDASCIIRTAWVYSSYGNNFVKTMLRLMSEKSELKVIDDQIGTPTWAKGLAEACVMAGKKKMTGVYHWTDEGVSSWYDFAIAIQEFGVQKGLISKTIPILPIPTSSYPTTAKRPHYSVLDKTMTREKFKPIKMLNWRDQLSMMMEELKNQP